MQRRGGHARHIAGLQSRQQFAVEPVVDLLAALGLEHVGVIFQIVGEQQIGAGVEELDAAQGLAATHGLDADAGGRDDPVSAPGLAHQVAEDLVDQFVVLQLHADGVETRGGAIEVGADDQAVLELPEQNFDDDTLFSDRTFRASTENHIEVGAIAGVPVEDQLPVERRGLVRMAVPKQRAMRQDPIAAQLDLGLLDGVRSIIQFRFRCTGTHAAGCLCRRPGRGCRRCRRPPILYAWPWTAP